MSKTDVVTSILFGDNHATKINLLNQDLLSIENKHLAYFQSIPPNQERNGQLDCLDNHYTIFTSENEITFRFNDDSILPVEMKNECLAAFRHRFGSQ